MQAALIKNVLTSSGELMNGTTSTTQRSSLLTHVKDVVLHDECIYGRVNTMATRAHRRNNGIAKTQCQCSNLAFI